MLARPNRLIVPQYSAPKNLSLVAAAELLGDGKRAIAAQVIDFAVRKVVTISRDEGKGRRSGFELRLADATSEGLDERAILVTLFGNDLTPGASLRIAPGRNRSLGAELKGPHRWIVARLISSGLARERGFWSKLVTPWRKEPVEPTEQAFPLVDHLWGIRDYIALAEKERFAFLQGPNTAQRREPLNKLEALVVNEKLLPYAVLFGLEKQWAAELDLQARDLPPELLDDLDGALVALEVVAYSADLISGVADLVQLVDAADALDGVGAFFGGLGDLLGSIDFPDFG